MPQVETNGSHGSASHLKAEATKAREQYTAYRTKCNGPTRTSPAKLQELKKNSILAKRRYQRAQAIAGE
jgi:hypothetical protein